MILDGMKAIRSYLEELGMRAGKARVRGLQKSGAPIRVTGAGQGKRYTADRDELRRWVGPATSGN